MTKQMSLKIVCIRQKKYSKESNKLKLMEEIF